MKRLYVGNLNFSTTEDDIWSACQAHGAVGSVHLVTDRATGRSRGFAFVEMPDDNEATQAIAALNGKNLHGRDLVVNEARPRLERSSPHRAEGGRRDRRQQRW